ncbi:MAG: hypothetical protein ACC635_07085 [Acidiferrobacterales bacterium]
MKKPPTISEEMLNIFADDELDAKEREQVLAEQMHDKEVARAICEIRLLKDLVKSARPQIDDTYTAGKTNKQRHLNKWLMVASVVLVITAGLVTLLPEKTNIAGPVKSTIATEQNYSDVNSFLSAQTNNPDLKIVLHINKNNAEASTRLIRQLEYLLKTTRKNHRPLRVEVVASGPGLAFVGQQTSPYAREIRLFRQEYDNLIFFACKKTLEKLNNKNNTNFKILPDVVLTASGTELIQLRKKQGWSHIVI